MMDDNDVAKIAADNLNMVHKLRRYSKEDSKYSDIINDAANRIENLVATILQITDVDKCYSITGKRV